MRSFQSISDATGDPRDRRLIVASNRGPVGFSRWSNGRYMPRKTSGGLASSLLSIARQSPLTWIAVAGDETDRGAFAERVHRTVRLEGAPLVTRYVPVPDRVYRMHYDEISNRTLWFLQHYDFHADLSPSFTANDEHYWRDGYEAVNRAVAEAIIDEVGCDPAEPALVLLQDYHLYLTPGMVRAALPDVTMGHFIHIPWPEARYWRLAPECFAREIIPSLLHNDVIGFQPKQDVQSFIGCVQEFVPDAYMTADHSAGLISWHGHHTIVRAYPISIDPEQVRATATSAAAQRSFAPIAHYFDRQVILRVDRLEPTKNILRGMQAFDLMLDLYPEMKGGVRFVMLLVPSREGVTRYRQYARQVTSLAQKINAKHGTPSEPVVVHISGNNQARALAAMREFDVMLANSIIDGMHLGAKEGAVVNQRDGVLVISRNAGVYQELSDGACLGISPTDLNETVQRLRDALDMPRAQRQSISAAARRRVESRTVMDWITDQLETLNEIADSRLGSPAIPVDLTASNLAPLMINGE